ncbi:DUF6776 family protein [Acinetobacter sp. MD2(2019)]|uniref:DUF6776 family protein n=1 Tax=Acinetobacter sp. MD2(2019) TaxID=2605273 RepID=UPI002D1EA822|nr:DUF6776 family protein [Acinetobacter sp. MD2(2019)]MEB3754219.1 hypothetical protein [Acinetobacter sp. MD2(2019)]
MTENATESNNPLDSKNQTKKPTTALAHKYVLIGGAVLLAGGVALGYTVGHRQGLTVVGYEADAAQLVEVVKKQKETLDNLNKGYNLAIQERDLAVSNVDALTDDLSNAKADLSIAQGQSQVYRSVLKERGGLSLTIQNLSIKPLPENAYEYQLDLAQVSPNGRQAAGNVEIRLIRGSEVLMVPMENKNFNFTDFARLTGRWTMPKGFVPQYIEVRVNGAVSEIKRFSWLRGQEVDNPASFVSEVPQAEAKSQ